MDSHHRYLSHHRQSLRPGSGSTMTSSMLASRYGFQLGTGSTGKRPGSCSSSPIRSRSNSTSRFKAAAAVAVAAATGNKQFGSAHRTSVTGSFNVLSSGSASTSGTNSSASSTASNSSGGSSGVGAGISSTVVSFMKKFVNKAAPNNTSGDSIDLSFEQYQKNLQQQQQQQRVGSTSGPSAVAAQSPTKYLFSTITGTGGSNNAGGQTSDTGYSSNANSPVTTPTVHSTSPSVPATTTTTSIIPPATTCSPTGSLVSLSSSTIYQVDLGSSSSRPSSASSVLNSSVTVSSSSSSTSTIRSGPLFSKIRAKMASTFQQQQPQATSNQQQITSSSTSFIQNPTISKTIVTESYSVVDSAKSTNAIQAGTPVTGSGCQRAPMLSMISQSSSLTNEQLTAHLTDEERQILQKVWQKEEEFREIALKNFKNITSTEMIMSVDTPTLTNAGSSTSPSLTGGVSHLSTNLLDPVAAAVHRRRSSAIMSADATGFCRICRKVIMKNETSHRCSNCQELVCDDCSSYSSREESKYWMCSFCRRRGSHLVLVTTSGQTSSISTLSTIVSSSNNTGTTITSSWQRSGIINDGKALDDSTMDNATNQLQFLSATGNVLNVKRKLSCQELQRPKSALEQYGSQQQQQQNRQNSLDSNRTLIKSSGIESKLNINNSPSTTLPLVKTQTNDSNRTRIYSLSDDEELWNNEEDDNDDDDDDEDDDEDDEDVLKDEEELDDRNDRIDGVVTGADLDEPDILDNNVKRNRSATKMKQQLQQQQSHYGTLQLVPVETLKLQRSNAQNKKKKKKAHFVQYNSDDELVMINSYGNKESNNSLFSNTPPITITSLEGPSDVSPSKFSSTQNQKQKPNFGSSSLNNGVSYQQCQNKQPKAPIMPKIISMISVSSSKPPPGAITATHWWRLTNKARSLTRANGGADAFYNSRKQLSSESSDFSDGFKYSPPQDSLTPSSEYSRSPRESADSDMLGLNSCYSSSLAAQCRGIPSVMVGDEGPGNQSGSPYLSTKDCYLRRGSTGRALPKIPAVATGSSMLDLPHSRKSSQHSLDIPTEQPRRASAPESGDPIRIVIDECGDLSASHMELTATKANEMDSDIVAPLPGPIHYLPGPIIQIPTHQTTLQQRMRYQLSRAASITTHYEHAVLQRDKTDQSTRTRGFSLAITGGKLSDIDGMLYAYITWIKPGGQADRQSLKSGNKILEWNGKSLVNCSHEQVCNIMDTSGDTVELIVESTVRNDQIIKRRHSLTTQQSPVPSTTNVESSNIVTTTTITTSIAGSISSTSARPSSAAAVISTTANGSLSSIPTSSTNAATNAIPVSGSLRRRLPQIPSQSNPTQSSNLLSDAQIFLQVSVDANIRQLSVMIIQSKGLDRHPIYAQNLALEAYAQLRLLPEMGFKICQTELSRTFDWNETLIYHQFPLERIETITLDLSIWCTTPATYIPGGSKPPRITITGSTSPVSPTTDHQLASTRIPLRSALLMHISEWWPLIPYNADVPSLLLNNSSTSQPLLDSSLQTSSMLLPTTTTTSTTSASMAPTVFFQKAPSMDHIGDPNIMLSDQMMMMMTSRSTPGSRRNSNRSEQELNYLNQSMVQASTATNSNNNRIKVSPTPPPPSSASWLQRYRSSSRASSTISSSTGRHSLDESYSILNSTRSGSSQIRFTSLRLAQNRHSVGNLYQMSPRIPTNAQHLSATDQQHLALRRKSSSALVQYHFDSESRNKLSIPGTGYSQINNTDSYQYLLEQNNDPGNNPEMEYQSDQESDLDTSDDDEDFDNLLKNSNYTLDSLENKERNNQQQIPQVKCSNNESNDSGKQLGNNNLLSIDIHGSRFSVATTSSASPRTPTHEEDDDDSQNGGLTIPVCQERRPSFLRRLVPSAAETVINMVMGGPGSNAQPSDEILHQNVTIEYPKRAIVVVGEIKLGFIMTKGFLEIEVIAARGLPNSTLSSHPPDTYVKTYLVDRGRQLYKRKTRVITSDKNPQYRQTLKYDASIIYGRTLLVSVWEKQRRRRTFDANAPIGSVEINVNQLQLHKLTIRWFKLRSFVNQNETRASTDLTGEPMLLQLHGSQNLESETVPPTNE